MSTGSDDGKAGRRRDGAREDLRLAHRELLRLIRRGGTTPVVPGRPSARQRAAHLVAAAEGILEGLRLSPPGPRPAPSLIERQAWVSLRMTWLVSESLAWLPGIPAAGALPPEELETRGARAVADWIALVDTLPAPRLAEAWWHHPALGPLNVLSWCRLFRILVRHHELEAAASP